METRTEDGRLVIELAGKVDSANADDVEAQLVEAVGSSGATDVVIGANGLDYISSAGLRVLLRLLRRVGSLAVVEASPEVYEVFDMTGFTEMIDVRRRLREVSVEGLGLIGEGANGRVYRLAPDQMIKVFRPQVTLAEIEEEREVSRQAFLLGVPCAISFDTVRVGDGYGTVYELLDAATLTERIREDPARLEGLAVASAELLGRLHRTEVPKGRLPEATRPVKRTTDAVAGYFSEQEAGMIRALWDSVPTMGRFVHNDYHTKNVMESAGELMLIDLGEAGAGNPVIDLVHCYMAFNLIGTGAGPTGDDDIGFLGLTYGEARRFWEVFSAAYWGGAEKAAEVDRLLEPYAQLMYLTVSMAHPMLPDEYRPAYAQKVRELVLPRYDEILGSLAGVVVP